MPLKISPYLSEDKIKARVKEMAKQINEDYKGEELLAVCVLKGSFIFYSDLTRQLDGNILCEFLAVSSYSGMTSSGEVKISLDLAKPIEGKNILLIEDIVDTGLTMNFLKTLIEARKPKSIKTAVLLHKPEAAKIKTELDYVGFTIANDFVVGYGLDYQGYYRNLPYIGQIQSLN